MEDVKFLQGTYGIAALIKDLLAGVQSGCIFNYYYYFLNLVKKPRHLRLNSYCAAFNLAVDPLFSVTFCPALKVQTPSPLGCGSF